MTNERRAGFAARDDGVCRGKGKARSFLGIIVILLRGGLGANGARISKDETVEVMLADHVACKLPGALEKTSSRR